MKLLAIETATEACSAALYIDGETVQDYRVAPRQHSQLILPMVEALLDTAGLRLKALDAVAFGRGPGSFTGVRIAAGIAQGMAWGADLPVVPVSTLAALAQGAVGKAARGRLLAAIDARMQEVYWGCYVVDEHGLVRLSGVEAVISPAQVALPDGDGWFGVGSGWAAYQAQLQTRVGRRVEAWDGAGLPQAVAVARLAADRYAAGETCPPAAAQPVYLRDQVAAKPAGS